MLDGVAGGFDIDGNGCSLVIVLPGGDMAVDGIDETVLWDGVEEAHEIIVGGM